MNNTVSLQQHIWMGVSFCHPSVPLDCLYFSCDVLEASPTVCLFPCQRSIEVVGQFCHCEQPGAGKEWSQNKNIICHVTCQKCAQWISRSLKVDSSMFCGTEFFLPSFWHPSIWSIKYQLGGWTCAVCGHRRFLLVKVLKFRTDVISGHRHLEFP